MLSRTLPTKAALRRELRPRTRAQRACQLQAHSITHAHAAGAVFETSPVTRQPLQSRLFSSDLRPPAPVFELAVGIPSMLPRPPPQNAAAAAAAAAPEQIPYAVAWAVLAACVPFYFLFVGVLVALYPTLREVRASSPSTLLIQLQLVLTFSSNPALPQVWRSAREVRKCAGAVIAACAEVEDLARDVRLNLEVRAQSQAGLSQEGSEQVWHQRIGSSIEV